MPSLYGIEQRPDGSKLPHPPPSLANCGTVQRRVRFSARLAGFCRDQVVTRDVLEGRNEASFSVLVSNLDFRVPRLRQRGGAGR